jgi:outer membrane immunogenic protein
MLQFLRGSVVLSTLVFAGSAIAADMPVKARAPIDPPYSWTGFYGGINGGMAIGTSCWTYLPGAVGFAAVAVPSDEGCHSPKGAFGGVQLGYNWQLGSWVLGVEANGDWGKIKGDSESILFANNHLQTTIKHFGTGVGRVGYAVMPTVLIYAKGGAGWESADYVRYVTSTGVVTATANETRLGWAGGAGAEWAFRPNMSVAVDYTYMGFGQKTLQFLTPAGVFGINEQVSQKLQAVTLKLNYKFGSM